MNAFNRGIVSVLCLGIATGAKSIVALAWPIPGESIDGLGDAGRWPDDHNDDGEKAKET